MTGGSTREATALPEHAFAVGLAGLGDMGPRRLRALLSGRTASEAWELVASGEAALVAEVAEVLAASAGRISARWAREAACTDLHALWRSHQQAEIKVLLESDGEFPEVLREDPEPPAVMFGCGDIESLDGPRVAVVGTRRCTRYGHDQAVLMGTGLAEAGVRVVSGLATGIDGAAHRGALGARGCTPVIGVVGNGLDVRYPPSNARLYESVAKEGLLLSEHPLGYKPRPWTFPARNRVIAALADVLVVIESDVSGGSVYTVDEALLRGRDVCAVPGPVHSRTSRGTNKMIFEGAQLVRGPEDVLERLGMRAAAAGRRRRKAPTAEGRAVLEAIGWEPATLEQLVLRTGMPLGALHQELERLESTGWIAAKGGIIERVLVSGHPDV